LKKEERDTDLNMLHKHPSRERAIHTIPCFIESRLKGVRHLPLEALICKQFFDDRPSLVEWERRMIQVSWEEGRRRTSAAHLAIEKRQ